MSKCKYASLATMATEALTSREAAKALGMSKSAIGDHRRGDCQCTSDPKTPAATGESETHNPDGSASYTRFSDRPWGFDDYCAFIRSTGQDPDAVTFTWGWTSNATGQGYWNKLNNVRPKPATETGLDEVDLPALYAAAKSAPRERPGTGVTGRSTVIVYTDPQIGKVARRGGTPALLERSEQIRSKLDDLLTERNPERTVILDGGDGFENFNSGGNPMFTNDLSLAGQMDLYGTELFEFISTAHRHAPVTVAGVPSNHTAWRAGKQLLGNPQDDLGLFMHQQVGRVTRAAGLDVVWVRPADYDETVALDVDGTMIGLVHGNQFAPGQAVQWWERQTFGAQAVAGADVLVHGHYHSFSASVAGRNPVSQRQRWCFGAPTLDNGSDWYRTTAGRDSDPGLLVFDVTPDGFDLSSMTILTA